jgi:hypothetical protein
VGKRRKDQRGHPAAKAREITNAQWDRYDRYGCLNLGRLLDRVALELLQTEMDTNDFGLISGDAQTPDNE